MRGSPIRPRAFRVSGCAPTPGTQSGQTANAPNHDPHDEEDPAPIRATDNPQPETAVTPDPSPADSTEEGRDRAAKSRKLADLWRRAFTYTAPGGASCTQSPTVGRSLGSSAPGVAEAARHEGAPGRDVGAAGDSEPDELTAVQLAVLATARAGEALSNVPSSTDTGSAVSGFAHANVPPLKAHPAEQAMAKGKIRPFTGTRRRVRVGPVGFTEPEHAELLEAAERHGYQSTLSGYVADIALAFIRGAFTVDLPLHTQKQEVQEFRAKIRYEINRVGVNINQMVYVLHRDNRIEPDIRERLERLDRLLTHIARALLLPTEPTAPSDREDA